VPFSFVIHGPSHSVATLLDICRDKAQPHTILVLSAVPAEKGKFIANGAGSSPIPFSSDGLRIGWRVSSLLKSTQRHKIRFGPLPVSF
jgi:hypothetical protein